MFGILIKIIVLVLLLCCSAFFSASETALTTVNRIRMRTLLEEGNEKAALVLQLTEQPAKMLSAILIGNNLANICASSLMTSLMIRLVGAGAVSYATGIMTLLVLIFGEISPKTMANLRAEKIAMRFAPIIAVLTKVLTPIIIAVNWLAGRVCRLFGVDASQKKAVLTAREIRTVMDVGHEHGVIDSDEKEMIDNVFAFGDVEAGEIMIPRIDMTFAQADMTFDEVLSIFCEVKFTRLPVYDDTTDDVIGILNMKDLLLCGREDFDLRRTMREPYFTFEHKRIDELFVDIRASSISMAIVLNDYGKTAGLITVEDLIEEIVGDIYDEFDAENEKPIQLIAEGEYLIDASTNLEDVNEALHLSLTSEDYDSLGGFMIGLLDHLPRVRESITMDDGLYLEARTISRHRIGKIYVRLPKEDLS